MRSAVALIAGIAAFVFLWSHGGRARVFAYSGVAVILIFVVIAQWMLRADKHTP